MKIEAKYQHNDGAGYHIYADGTYYKQLDKEEILEILTKYFQERENK